MRQDNILNIEFFQAIYRHEEMLCFLLLLIN